MIHENEFIFARYRLFQKYRYIIIASLDNVNEQGDDWEGKINSMMNYMDEKFNDANERTANYFKSMVAYDRNLFNFIRDQDHKMSDINSKA